MCVKLFEETVHNLKLRIIQMASPLLKKIADRISDAKNERASLRAEVAKLSKQVEEERKAFEDSKADKDVDDSHIVELEDKVSELQSQLDKTAAEEAEEDAQEADILKSLEDEDGEKKEDAPQGAPATPEQVSQTAADVTSAPVTETNAPAEPAKADEEEAAKADSEDKPKDEQSEAEAKVGEPDESAASLDPFVREEESKKDE